MDGRASFERDVAGIGALVDPVRRQLYQFVCSQSMPVSRDQAADAVGIPRHQAKFHLDRLTAEDLLDTEYARLTGRSGPGAGRTAKLYRRAGRDIALSLPQREYELAGRLMAAAIVLSATTGSRPWKCSTGSPMTTAKPWAPPPPPGRPQTPRRRWS